MPGADARMAYAAEFAAYRLGQIDEKSKYQSTVSSTSRRSYACLPKTEHLFRRWC